MLEILQPRANVDCSTCTEHAYLSMIPSPAGRQGPTHRCPRLPDLVRSQLYHEVNVISTVVRAEFAGLLGHRLAMEEGEDMDEGQIQTEHSLLCLSNKSSEPLVI